MLGNALVYSAYIGTVEKKMEARSLGLGLGV